MVRQVFICRNRAKEIQFKVYAHKVIKVLPSLAKFYVFDVTKCISFCSGTKTNKQNLFKDISYGRLFPRKIQFQV